jgi:hypothetical protein
MTSDRKEPTVDQHDHVRAAVTRCARCSGAMLPELVADEGQLNGLDVGSKCMLCGHDNQKLSTIAEGPERRSRLVQFERDQIRLDGLHSDQRATPSDGSAVT